MDVALVATSLVDLFLSSFKVNFGFGSRHFRSVRLLRILRTVRLFRTLKSIREFRKMAFRIMSSVKTLVCSLVILFFIVYCYGLLLCQGVTEFRLKESYLSHENVDLETRYGSLPNTLYSLFAAVTQGIDWDNAVQPLKDLHVVYSAGLLVYISLVLLGVMNVVTSVFV